MLSRVVIVVSHSKNLVLPFYNRNYLPRSRAEAKLGNTISPMLAKKTTCASITTDLSVKHRDHAKNLRQDEPGASSLALKFPPFICEVKLDGERMVVHVNRGIVTMQVSTVSWSFLNTLHAMTDIVAFFSFLRHVAQSGTGK
jgi:hypothetical protein